MFPPSISEIRSIFIKNYKTLFQLLQSLHRSMNNLRALRGNVQFWNCLGQSPPPHSTPPWGGQMASGDEGYVINTPPSPTSGECNHRKGVLKCELNFSLAHPGWKIPALNWKDGVWQRRERRMWEFSNDVSVTLFDSGKNTNLWANQCN